MISQKKLSRDASSYMGNTKCPMGETFTNCPKTAKFTNFFLPLSRMFSTMVHVSQDLLMTIVLAVCLSNLSCHCESYSLDLCTLYCTWARRLLTVFGHIVLINGTCCVCVCVNGCSFVEVFHARFPFILSSCW